MLKSHREGCQMEDISHWFTYHVGTCTGKGHELGVELQTGNGACVFAIQHSYFYSALSIPDMDLAIL